ncbi:MAG TPA: O-antigen ligase family protein [Blastocatellia bacterium]|nr:O-antigen ligase family protein [Blastocatellia bacterium]
MIATGLLVAVVFTALAYGAVEAWSVAIFELIVVALLALWTIQVLVEKRVTLSIPAAALPLAALVVVGLIQSVAFTSGEGRRLSLSKDVEATRSAVTVIFYLLASHIIAANFFTTRRRLLALTRFLIIYGLAMAIFAFAQHFSWNGRFYWLRPNTQTASPFGPFASHNHFAGYMEMLTPIPVAFVVARAVRGGQLVFCVLASVVMGIAIMASLSRGGMIGFFASLVFLALGGLCYRKKGEAGTKKDARARRTISRAAFHPSLVVIILIVTIAAGIFFIGPQAIMNRVTGRAMSGSQATAETFFSSRGWIWQDTLLMIGANPVTGVGIGAYQTAYPIYSRSDGALTVSHAHNDYLQALSDCGVPGGLIAAWFIVAIFRAVARGLRSSEPGLRGFALGGGAGLLALLVHSILDFNLQIPSNALLFLLLTAVVSRVGAMAQHDQAATTRAASD